MRYYPVTCSKGSPEKGQSVCAVIVTYNPGRSFIDNVGAIASEADGIILVDNGSSSESRKRLSEAQRRFTCKLICYNNNLGLATALNAGVKLALDGGYGWIATFDQDSRICDGFFFQMLKAYKESDCPDRVAILSPHYIDRNSGVEVRLRRAHQDILATMTSGSMTPSTAFHKLGLFDESLFIDAVDKEFCLRARRNGMKIVQSSSVLLHSLGRTTYHHLWGLRFGATNHSPERRYYIIRNGLRMLMRYGNDWPWVWREASWMFLDAVKIALVEDQKWAKFCAMTRGALDAAMGRMGKQVEL